MVGMTIQMMPRNGGLSSQLYKRELFKDPTDAPLVCYSFAPNTNTPRFVKIGLNDDNYGLHCEWRGLSPRTRNVRVESMRFQCSNTQNIVTFACSFFGVRRSNPPPANPNDVFALNEQYVVDANRNLTDLNTDKALFLFENDRNIVNQISIGGQFLNVDAEVTNIVGTSAPILTTLFRTIKHSISPIPFSPQVPYGFSFNIPNILYEENVYRGFAGLYGYVIPFTVDTSWVKVQGGSNNTNYLSYVQTDPLEIILPDSLYLFYQNESPEDTIDLKVILYLVSCNGNGDINLIESEDVLNFNGLMEVT